MNIATILGIAMLAASFSVMLRKKTPEFSLVLSLATGVVIIGMIIMSATPLFERIASLLHTTGAKAEYVQILFKVLGICFITQIACDACKDLGESAIAAKIETAGKVSVLLISLPLFEQILGIAAGLIG